MVVVHSIPPYRPPASSRIVLTHRYSYILYDVTVCALPKMSTPEHCRGYALCMTRAFHTRFTLLESFALLLDQPFAQMLTATKPHVCDRCHDASVVYLCVAECTKLCAGSFVHVISPRYTGTIPALSTVGMDRARIVYKYPSMRSGNITLRCVT